MFLIFDTETTGLPRDFKAPVTDSDNWPRLVQLAWQIHDEKGALTEVKNFIIRPDGFTIPYSAEKIHGISTQRAQQQGMPLSDVLQEFNKALAASKFVVGHNIIFDVNIMGAEYHRMQMDTPLIKLPFIDTKEEGTNFCALPGGRGGGFKWPNLTELHHKLFNEGFDEAHNASADVEATARCFLELVRIGEVTAQRLQFSADDIHAFKANNPEVIQAIGLNIEPYSPITGAVSPVKPQRKENSAKPASGVVRINPDELPFAHLHVHTKYSILDGAAAVPTLVAKAKADGMKAIAITDHGNMFGAKLLHKTANKEGIKPILGCEVYVARRSRLEKKDKVDQSGHHLILLAKNEEGYHNLVKMVSYSWLEGYYYKPRIDKELLQKYHKGVIACSACLAGEVSQTIMHKGIDEAEKIALEFKALFGEDYYLEIQRHETHDPNADQQVYVDQKFVNEHILEISRRTGIKVVATNDVHFVNQEDAPAHDRLICLNTGKNVDDPNRMHYSQQEWFKTRKEMYQIFKDVPDTLITTGEIADKVEEYPLDHKPIMPKFEIPESFGLEETYHEKYDEAALLEEFGEKAYERLGGYNNVVRIKFESDYLEHIVYEGAAIRWGDYSKEYKERIDFELNTIKTMGFPGYFLIVWDFLKAARDLGVSVGPGRGSAAGSVVAYSLRITEIDPIKYNLLFERFLNPDRISMPDIDIDFDDEGRGKVLGWVVNKYGLKRVAHIVTFGTMAAKSAIRDVARVQSLPLSESDRLAKMVPEKPGMNLKKAYEEVPELRHERDSGPPEIASVLRYAQILEGSVRSTGTHACGIIIGRDDLEEHIPISTAKDSELTYVTQYDGKHVEDVGLLKMDFLGLKTLSIIKDAVENIKLSKSIEVDIENVDLEDKKAYELFSKGETTGIFQFESEGMKKYLRELEPSRFEDLIAMNALYRPGPMEYIPQFIARKHGREPIVYDIPIMEEYLSETYGITVYQEQVMLLSRKMAGFTRGQSDSLRKAMGKKLIAMMDELKVKFVEGCKANNLPEKMVLKVWSDWEAFAKYAFNKSHATCYSFVAYQTGYLKAHYPAEYMASVLSHNLSDIKKVTFFIEECKRMGLEVLGPDVNESYRQFTVNAKGEIRFGMAAIKGVGESAVEEIIRERQENGPFKNVVDLVKRVNLRTVNRKSLECLALAGGFDGFPEQHRAQFFHQQDGENVNFLEKLVRFGNRYQENLNSAQASLFGDAGTVELPDLEFPKTEPWSKIVMLRKEKEVIGFYLSGHPLDVYKLEIKAFCSHTIGTINNEMERLLGASITFAGIVTTAAVDRQTKTGKPFGIATIEDLTESREIALFGDEYLKWKRYLDNDGQFLMIQASVVPRRFGNGEPELKINTISLLSEVMDKKVKNVTVSFDLPRLTAPLVDSLVALVKNIPGEAKVRFRVTDPVDQISIDMPTTRLKVNPAMFIQKADKLPDVDIKLN